MDLGIVRTMRSFPGYLLVAKTNGGYKLVSVERYAALIVEAIKAIKEDKNYEC